MFVHECKLFHLTEVVSKSLVFRLSLKSTVRKICSRELHVFVDQMIFVFYEFWYEIFN